MSQLHWFQSTTLLHHSWKKVSNPKWKPPWADFRVENYVKLKKKESQPKVKRSNQIQAFLITLIFSRLDDLIPSQREGMPAVT